MNEAKPDDAVAPSRRILFLNDLGFQYGAGIAEARQIQSMIEIGWEAGALTWEAGGLELEQVATRPLDPDRWLGIRSLQHLSGTHGLSDDAIVSGVLSEIARFAPTVVVVGNLHCPSWPLRLIPAVAALGCRVIAYMHDGYLFSGRCAYPGSCNLYLTGCNETCPTADQYPPLPPPLIAGQWRLRRDIFGGSGGIEVVANSEWNRDLFRLAMPSARSVETVYLGADSLTFTPGDKAAAREALGLPRDKKIILCAAVNFEEARKGSNYLRRVAGAFSSTEVVFAAFGHNTSLLPELIGLGYHTDAHHLARIYQAADLFLGTATEEAFGQTIMEAQLCGIPVVAFNVGGVGEIVRNEITGKLVLAGDTAALVAAIRGFLDNDHRRFTAGVWGRASAETRFSLLAQGRAWERYLDGVRPLGTGPSTPTRLDDRPVGEQTGEFVPSWPRETQFISPEHEQIFEHTQTLPGWQMKGDSWKLFEMGYHAGDVILEIGTYGGRSATVELRGALANPARTHPPRFYGIDISADSIARTRQTLSDQQLVDYSHLFEGTFTEFAAQWRIKPTMVFLDGDHRYEGVAADMATLSRYLEPGTPVLVHDFLNAENDTGEYGVRRAGLEWAAAGWVRFAGCSGCSALFITEKRA